MALNYPNKGFCRRFGAGLRQAINKSIVKLGLLLRTAQHHFVVAGERVRFFCADDDRALLVQFGPCEPPRHGSELGEAFFNCRSL